MFFTRLADTTATAAITTGPDWKARASVRVVRIERIAAHPSRVVSRAVPAPANILMMVSMASAERLQKYLARLSLCCHHYL